MFLVNKLEKRIVARYGRFDFGKKYVKKSKTDNFWKNLHANLLWNLLILAALKSAISGISLAEVSNSVTRVYIWRQKCGNFDVMIFCQKSTQNIWQPCALWLVWCDFCISAYLHPPNQRPTTQSLKNVKFVKKVYLSLLRQQST